MFKVKRTTDFLVEVIVTDNIPYWSSLEYNYLMSFECLLKRSDFKEKYSEQVNCLLALFPCPNNSWEILTNMKEVATRLFEDLISNGRIIMYLFFLKNYVDILKSKFSFDLSQHLCDLSQHLDKIWSNWINENGGWVHIFQFVVFVSLLSFFVGTCVTFFELLDRRRKKRISKDSSIPKDLFGYS